MKPVLLALFALALGAAPTWAQSPSAQPCPPANAGETTGASASPGTGQSAPKTYAGPRENQPVEHSAILPEAGGEKESAAPTVQQDGKSVVAQTECPKPSNRLDAPKPQ
jgi:hypothetical protein